MKNLTRMIETKMVKWNQIWIKYFRGCQQDLFMDWILDLGGARMAA